MFGIYAIIFENILRTTGMVENSHNVMIFEQPNSGNCGQKNFLSMIEYVCLSIPKKSLKETL